MTSVEQRRQGGGIDEFELEDLDQVDDLLIRPGRGSSKDHRASGPCGLTRGGLCCRKEVLRLIFLSLLFFACGALVGHVTVRYKTTDSTLYSEARVGDDFTTRFMVVGDWGRQGKYHQAEVALQMALVGAVFRPNFVISTGDNFYPSGLKRVNDTLVKESFVDIYNYPSLNVPWYAVLGNHDYGDGSAKHDFSTKPAWQSTEWMEKLDKRWICCGGRDFNTKKVTEDLDLFFLDTSPFVHEYYGEPWASVEGGILDEKDKVQKQVADLDLALERSIAKWKIVVGHHPVRSNGRHGDTAELVSVLPDILNKQNVDFYLNGHEHDLQDITEPTNKNLRYVTSGSGSKTRLESGMGHNKKNFFSITSGFVTVALSEKAARVQFWYFDATLAYQYVIERK